MVKFKKTNLEQKHAHEVTGPSFPQLLLPFQNWSDKNPWSQGLILYEENVVLQKSKGWAGLCQDSGNKEVRA